MKQHGSLITSGSVHIRAAAMHAPEDMRVDLDMPEGSTVAEIVAAALPGASNAELTHARVTLVNKGSMAVIERGLWHRVRPHAGTSVVIRIVPQGDKLKGILSVVVAIAALAIGIYLAPVLAAAGTFGITNAATWQAIIGRGVTLIGTLAINALIPPPSTSSDTPKPNYAISGWRNNLTPDGIVPSVMGKHRYAPPFAMTPYIEIIDGTQYINA
ncbi:MAG: tail fiber protein, partial [Bradyrhizobium sp.]|nr:tail fiber protein [Bradyrhizobium sp.]